MGALCESIERPPLGCMSRWQDSTAVNRMCGGSIPPAPARWCVSSEAELQAVNLRVGGSIPSRIVDSTQSEQVGLHVRRSEEPQNLVRLQETAYQGVGG